MDGANNNPNLLQLPAPPVFPGLVQTGWSIAQITEHHQKLEKYQQDLVVYNQQYANAQNLYAQQQWTFQQQNTRTAEQLAQEQKFNQVMESVKTQQDQLAAQNRLHKQEMDAKAVTDQAAIEAMNKKLDDQKEQYEERLEAEKNERIQREEDLKEALEKVADKSAGGQSSSLPTLASKVDYDEWRLVFELKVKKLVDGDLMWNILEATATGQKVNNTTWTVDPLPANNAKRTKDEVPEKYQNKLKGFSDQIVKSIDKEIKTVIVTQHTTCVFELYTKVRNWAWSLSSAERSNLDDAFRKHKWDYQKDTLLEFTSIKVGQAKRLLGDTLMEPIFEKTLFDIITGKDILPKCLQDRVAMMKVTYPTMIRESDGEVVHDIWATVAQLDDYAKARGGVEDAEKQGKVLATKMNRFEAKLDEKDQEIEALKKDSEEKDVKINRLASKSKGKGGRRQHGGGGYKGSDNRHGQGGFRRERDDRRERKGDRKPSPYDKNKRNFRSTCGKCGKVCGFMAKDCNRPQQQFRKKGGGKKKSWQ